MARQGVKRRLSQTLGQIAKGFAVDTFEGGFPITQVIPGPANGSSNAVHAAITLTAEEQIVTTGITNPDAFRALSVKGNQPSVLASVVISGKDWADRNITETIIASGNGVISGDIPFKSIDSITVPALVGGGDTVEVGTLNKLGLYRPLAHGQSNLLLLEQNNTVDTVSAFDTVYETFTPNTNPDGSKNYKAHYLTDVF